MLLEYRHLAKAASAPTAAEEDGARRFRLDEYGGAHLDAAAELASYVAEEPILGDAEAGMLVKGLD